MTTSNTPSNPFISPEEVSFRVDSFTDLVAKQVYQHLNALSPSEQRDYLHEIGDNIFGLLFEGGLSPHLTEATPNG